MSDYIDKKNENMLMSTVTIGTIEPWISVFSTGTNITEMLIFIVESNIMHNQILTKLPILALSLNSEQFPMESERSD